MTAIQLTLNLPDKLAQQARTAGLLTPEAVRRLVEAELRQQHVDRMFAAADRLADLDLPPLTEDEIQAEIDAVRAERRTRAARHR